jgi:hypothetical protein
MIISILSIATAFTLASCSGGMENQGTEQEKAHEMEHKHNFNGSAEIPKALAKKAVASQNIQSEAK